MIKPLLEATAKTEAPAKELPRGNGTTPLIGVREESRGEPQR